MNDLERAFSVCAYCFRPIAEDGSGFIKKASITTAEGYGPDEFRGQGVEVARADGSIVGCIPEEHSEVAEEGWNFLIFVCSRKCGKAADAFLSLPAPVELHPFPEDLSPRQPEDAPARKSKWWNPFSREPN